MRGCVRAVLLCLAGLPSAGECTEVLTTAGEVRALTAEETREGRQVRIRAVVTYFSTELGSDFTVQDETGGLFARGELGDAGLLRPGQEVVIEGVTGMDPPTPRILLRRLEPGGMVGLPEPVRESAERIVEGRLEGRRVEVTGVIRTAKVEESLHPPRLVLSFGPPERSLSIWLARFDDATVARLVPDTRIRVRGVSTSWRSASFQQISSLLVVHDASQVEILSPAPGDPLALPETPLPELFTVHGDEYEERRRRVKGVVTLCWPGKLVVLQNDQGAVRVHPRDAGPLRLGDEVSAMGFVSRVKGGLVLEEAVFGEGEFLGLPQAEVVGRAKVIEEAWELDRDGRYLKLGGVLREMWSREEGHVFVIESGGGVFKARLPAEARLPMNFQPGSHVELSGVCVMVLSKEARQIGMAADGFEIDLPDIRSISVVAAPPWWTAERLGVVLAAILGVLGLSLLWGFMLRRRVERRGELLVREIRARHDAELVAAERMRLAGDLHDTLSQSLSGAAMQLEVAGTLAGPEGEADEHFVLAKRLLDRSREDLRRAVWDLSPSGLADLDLAAALGKVAREVAGDRVVEVTKEGDVAGLPERVRAHLFRVGQEALGNALRHGDPKKVKVRVEVSEGAVVLAVEDDGCGFDPERAPGPDEGHFGLRSLKERVARLGGRLEISSSPEGTRVVADVPLSE